MDKSKGMYYMYKQKSSKGNAKHLRKFKSTVDAIEHLGGDMFANKALIEHEKEEDKRNGTTIRNDREIRLCVREKMTYFIKTPKHHNTLGTAHQLMTQTSLAV